MTYKEWWKAVNTQLILKYGVSTDMLPDWNSYDAWSDGMTIDDAVEKIIEWAKTF